MYAYSETTGQLATLSVREKDEKPPEDVRTHSCVEHPKLPSVGHLLWCMSSWCTSDTLVYVSQARQSLSQRKCDSHTETSKSSTNTECTGSEVEIDSDVSVQGSDMRERSSEDDKSASVPTVHSVGQKQLQRTIFIEQLKRK